MDKLEYFVLKNSDVVEKLIKLEEKNAIFESESKDFNNWKELVYKALIHEDIKIADNSKNTIYESMFANGYTEDFDYDDDYDNEIYDYDVDIIDTEEEEDDLSDIDIFDDDLTESWTDIYREFETITNDPALSAEEISNKVDGLYAEHEGDSDWDEAYRKWQEGAEDVDLFDDDMSSIWIEDEEPLQLPEKEEDDDFAEFDDTDFEADDDISEYWK